MSYNAQKAAHALGDGLMMLLMKLRKQEFQLKVVILINSMTHIIPILFAEIQMPIMLNSHKKLQM